MQPLTLERAHVYSVDKQQVSIIQVRGTKTAFNPSFESNGNGTASSNLQRSPSVGSRPTSMMSVSNERPGKPPRPDMPEHAKVHARTRSEGNIIDVQTQTETVIVQKSPQHQTPASPRVVQRPPRPQPPPPPPPTGGRTKSDHESTNLWIFLQSLKFQVFFSIPKTRNRINEQTVFLWVKENGSYSTSNATIEQLGFLILPIHSGCLGIKRNFFIFPFNPLFLLILARLRVRFQFKFRNLRITSGTREEISLSYSLPFSFGIFFYTVQLFFL